MMLRADAIIVLPEGAVVQRAGVVGDATGTTDLVLVASAAAKNLHGEDVAVLADGTVRSRRGFYAELLETVDTRSGTAILVGTTIYVQPYVAVLLPSKSAGGKAGVKPSAVQNGNAMLGVGLLAGAVAAVVGMG